MKRLLALMLCFVFVFSSVFLSACGEDKKSSDDSEIEESESKDNNESAQSEPSDAFVDNEASDGFSADNSSVSSDGISSAPADDTSSAPSDDGNNGDNPLGELAVGFKNEPLNWGGETVNILGYNGEFTYYACQIDEEFPGDEPVANSLYERNVIIEETYGIDINLVLPESHENPIQLLRDDVASGLCEYQAIVNAIQYVAPLAGDGLLVDFNGVRNSYLHLDQPWWDQSMISDVQLDGKVFFLTGDALLEDDEATWCMYFNKDLVENYGLEDPYELVESGAWNLDKMYEMTKKVNVMIGSTKVFSADSEDVWGLIVQSYDYYLFMQGCEQPMVDNTGDTPVLRVMEEENVTTFRKIAAFWYDSVNVGVADYHGSWADNPPIYDVEKQIFANGNALFMPGSISYVGTSEFKNSDVNYGILPMPKRNDLQEYYSAGVNTYHAAVFAIPITNVYKLDVTCYALEAMAYYGSELVVPEYYNILTFKRFDDAEAEAMLDYIFDNRTYDLGSIYNFSNGDAYNGTLYFYTNLLGEKSDDIVSKYRSVEASFQAGIDKLIVKCYN